jgi:2',3'-cyclic-nucleotide 2'-phosphodiesterase (5'-nucleotidase family)
VARRATKINEERKTDGPILVLDAGNSLTGDRDPARESEGATSVEVMNLMGYDAMALGPMDLSLGRDALGERIAEAQFHMLSANAIDSTTGGLLAEPFTVLGIDTMRVAIIGVSGPSSGEDIEVGDPVKAVKDAVSELTSQAELVIVLSNAGVSVDQQIADTIPGVAAIIEGGAGASATAWRSDVTGTPVFHADEASAGHAGRFLGVARLVLNRDGSLRNHAWERFSLGPEVGDDPSVAAWVASNTGG